MKRLRNVGSAIALGSLLLWHSGCFYKSTEFEPPERRRPYYEGVAVGSPWHGFPYGPPGWYPSDVQLGGARLGGRY